MSNKAIILKSIFETAQIHVKRIEYAAVKINHYFPMNEDIIEKISDEDLGWFELYTGRFSKLQDLMGNTLFPKLLEAVEEPTETMTFLDKLNRLEKLFNLELTDNWITLRQLRNHLSHEYPDEPTLTAQYLNNVFDSKNLLLNYLNKSLEFAKAHNLL